MTRSLSFQSGAGTRKEYKHELGPSPRLREGCGREDLRYSGQGRGVHGKGIRRVRHRSEVNQATVTAQTEAFQAVLWHLIVSHPQIRLNQMKWESVKQGE